MRSYIDAGNDIFTAEDVFKALHYGKDIQNVKVGCNIITMYRNSKDQSIPFI